MNILCETDELILENEHETTRLKIKSTDKVLFEEDFYGDPCCGLIDSKNKWAIVAGDHLTIWTPKQTERIEHENIQGVHALRLKDSETVEILIDPWSEISAVWELYIAAFEIRKIKDFDVYKEKEYSDEVIW